MLVFWTIFNQQLEHLRDYRTRAEQELLQFKIDLADNQDIIDNAVRDKVFAEKQVGALQIQVRKFCRKGKPSCRDHTVIKSN